ncbi:hypothetical protein GJ25_gp034 [Mycobacterium phage Hawkeye]|uniref:Uncharacterized protein n=1 Tax=Mycobacterium phage Hawkeye TaxID=1458711 RepID=X2KT13_9CAUD|nr:hypothetical protein GJ25_gp034 [Mycobacterium phage Hawkeye]AHN84045.1 hypothetical protein PBI_HAWKEYE_34 [Mycobacterium phage Hawkeye]
MIEMHCPVQVKRNGKTVPCGFARIIPSGSQTPRCPIHEPTELWLDAEAGFRNRVEIWLQAEQAYLGGNS